jgi:hypothetical protein
VLPLFDRPRDDSHVLPTEFVINLPPSFVSQAGQYRELEASRARRTPLNLPHELGRQDGPAVTVGNGQSSSDEHVRSGRLSGSEAVRPGHRA